MNIVSQIIVSLKARDPVAMTATQAVREKMGISSLSRITLSDLWELSFDTDSVEKVRAFTQMLVERSIIFVNPNKHNYVLRADSETVPWQAGQGGEPVCVVSYLRGRAKDPVLVERVRRRFDLQELAEIKRGRLWVLEFDSADKERSLAIARQIAEAESRRMGLLVNPHAEECRILVGELPLGVIR